MRRLLLVLAPSLLLTCVPPVCAQDALSNARALYQAARYEDALGAFDAMKSGGRLTRETALAVEQGRAFCLLALDRKADAQAAITEVVDLDPFFLPGEDDTAPKIRAAFRDARRRALPATLDHLSSRARDAYDRREYADAAAGFTQVLALLDDPDLTLEPGPRADTRLVVTGFLNLARAASTPASTGGAPQVAQPAPALATPAKPAGAAGPASLPPQTGLIGPLFNASAKDVTPPVPVRTPVDIPDVMRPNGTARTVAVEVVVSAQGTVESATPQSQNASVYTDFVIRAVLDWRYKPAMRAGTPVRYRMLVHVVILPRGG